LFEVAGWPLGAGEAVPAGGAGVAAPCVLPLVAEVRSSMPLLLESVLGAEVPALLPAGMVVELAAPPPLVPGEDTLPPSAGAAEVSLGLSLRGMA